LKRFAALLKINLLAFTRTNTFASGGGTGHSQEAKHL